MMMQGLANPKYFLWLPKVDLLGSRPSFPSIILCFPTTYRQCGGHNSCNFFSNFSSL